MANTWTWEQIIVNIENIVNRGSVSKTFTPSGSEQTYTVPQGYHSGSGVVTCKKVSLSGDATTGSVLKGKTFYTTTLTKQTGTLEFTGDADTGHVLKDKTFYKNSTTKLTGTMQIVNPTHWSEANKTGGRQVDGTNFILGNATYNDSNTYMYIELPNKDAYYNGVDFVRMSASNLPYYSGFVGNTPTHYGYTNENGGGNDFYMFIPNKGYYTTERYLSLNVNKVMAKIIWNVFKYKEFILYPSTTKYHFKGMDSTSPDVDTYYLTINIPETVTTYVTGASWQTNGVSSGNANWYIMAHYGACDDNSSGTDMYPYWSTFGPGSQHAPGIALSKTFGDNWHIKNPFYLPVGKTGVAYKVGLEYITWDNT